MVKTVNVDLLQRVRNLMTPKTTSATCFFVYFEIELKMFDISVISIMLTADLKHQNVYIHYTVSERLTEIF